MTFGVWCAVTGRKSTQQGIVQEMTNIYHHVRLIVALFSEGLTEETERTVTSCRALQQYRKQNAELLS
jgi:hypothetical protein